MNELLISHVLGDYRKDEGEVCPSPERVWNRRFYCTETFVCLDPKLRGYIEYSLSNK